MWLERFCLLATTALCSRPTRKQSSLGLIAISFPLPTWHNCCKLLIWVNFCTALKAAWALFFIVTEKVGMARRRSYSVRIVLLWLSHVAKTKVWSVRLFSKSWPRKKTTDNRNWETSETGGRACVATQYGARAVLHHAEKNALLPGCTCARRVFYTAPAVCRGTCTCLLVLIVGM